VVFLHCLSSLISVDLVTSDDCIPLDDIVPMDDLVALPGSVILDDQGDPIPSDDLDGDAPTFDPIPSVGYPILFINQVASNNAVPSGNIIEKVVKDEEAPSSDEPQLTVGQSSSDVLP
jgi:hypothetical protein